MTPKSSQSVLFLAFAGVVIASAWIGGLVAEQIALGRLEATARERTTIYQSTLVNAVDRLQHLPLVVSQHPAVSQLLVDGRGLGATHSYLASVNEASDAAVIYVLDRTGKTVAASNWQSPESFVGKNYGFRPYFQDALAGGSGRFFAVGVTTGRPGFFVAKPVSAPVTLQIVGVVAVKLELDNMQADWREGGENVFVTDENDVIIFSSNPDWAYHSLSPLSAEARQQISVNRTYGKKEIAILEADRAGNFIRLANGHFLSTKTDLPTYGWRLHYLADLEPVAATRWLASLSLLVISGLSLFGFLYVRERHRKRASDKEAAEARAIRGINQRLEAEVETRRNAEAELRDAQAELIQAGKLAALGQMSAAIAHEVNQPISAIRTFAASGRLLLDRGQTGDAGETLDQIAALTEKIAQITGDLKVFARRSDDHLHPVSLPNSVEQACGLFAGEMEAAEVTLEKQIEAHDLNVLGNSVRIEQVLVNLLRNALDAVREKSGVRRIMINLARDGEDAVLRVQDNGPGIDDTSMKHVFDPFFTTKPVGEGVGLGLAISYSIVEEMGGRLRAQNAVDGGAVFSLRLKSLSADQLTEEVEAAE